MGFEDSLLALYLGSHAPAAHARGRERILSAGQWVPASHPGVLHVVLAGTVQASQGWLGPGNHILGNEDIRVTSETATLWTLDRRWSRGFDDRDGAVGSGSQPSVDPVLDNAVEASLEASSQAVRAATPGLSLPDPSTLCDVGHPAIRDRAAKLVRGTEAQTAESIFLFVQAMPYRFGTWQERASDTLARGAGMCTTKANLQAALLRAAGLEAGFVEMPISIDVLGLQMPSAWLAMMRPQVKHYFGAVKLGGRWHAADSSYTDDSLGVYLRAFPQMSALKRAYLREGHPFSPIAAFNGIDPFDIHVVPHLQGPMSKKSRFEPVHFEALNTRLDRLQGSWRRWLPEGSTEAAATCRQGVTERDV